ncbi:hypothetical protein GCM10008018_17900 [Paenibacillus marchantiophytorum]|uniref:Methyltransferase type 11 domain-containing protein n=1 Tax=Paenibacillus marchantiophytorum TaxID=1619310 RepID=A0ABQ2BSH0_9BACL|nr:methyltransferase domain-containing protein [Paenibacillus marchantiophytorum]GGI46599.1 hypothetical protein GCM10008018_17900 [Paenibacillus marchantiophytorum]
MRIELLYGKNVFPKGNIEEGESVNFVDGKYDSNRPLPLQDHSVNFTMASHCLQYVDNLQTVMEEIYRVSCHKAIVCIVAPYAHVTSHMVNPRFKQQFNEHLPRYWTTYPESVLDPDEFMLSSQANWSLMEPEDQDSPYDFRLIRIEFFYFPQYGSLYEEIELKLLRQSQLNVAYQIMYHLVVVKQPISMEELALLATGELEEPNFVINQRTSNQEREDNERLFELPFLPGRKETEHIMPTPDPPKQKSLSKKRASMKGVVKKQTPASRRPLKKRRSSLH